MFRGSDSSSSAPAGRLKAWGEGEEEVRGVSRTRTMAEVERERRREAEDGMVNKEARELRKGSSMLGRGEKNSKNC